MKRWMLLLVFALPLLALAQAPAAPQEAKRDPAKWIGLDELMVPALTAKGQDALLARQRVCFLNLHRRPDDVANLAAIAEVQLKLGRYALAADYAQRLVHKDPTERRAFRLFIQALYFSGRHELAVALNERAVQLGFDDPINRLFLAEMHIRKGDPNRAATELVRVIGELDETNTGLNENELRPLKLYGLENQAELYRFLGRDVERDACLELIEKLQSGR